MKHINSGLQVLGPISFLLLAGCMATATEQNQDEFRTRYVDDRFHGAVYVQLDKLAAAPFAPWLVFSPDAAPPVSLRRLQAAHVSELIVLVGPGADEPSESDTQLPLHWAAAARCRQAVTVPFLLQQWRDSTIAGRQTDFTEPQIVRHGDREFVRVPAGSFLPAPRIPGSLRFTDRHGQPVREGINVGRVNEERGYLEGGTECSAIFAFSQVDEADLIADHLSLELRVDEFRTYRLASEFSRAQLFLRNPDTLLRSEPVAFEVKSYANQEVRFPRTLTVIDAAGQQRPGDLLRDLVSQGKVEAVLKGSEPAVYLGVGPRDANLRVEAFEYLHVSGRDVVVAQSPETLDRLLASAEQPGPLAGRLARHAGDLTVVLDPRDPALRQWMRAIASQLGELLPGRFGGDDLVAITANLQADPVTADITLETSTPDRALLLRVRWNHAVRHLQSLVHAGIDEFLKGDDGLGGILSLIFQGVSLRFPHLDATDGLVRRQLQKMVDDSFATALAQSEDATVRVSFRPPEFWAELHRLARLALAWCAEERARSLTHSEQFELGAELYAQATNHLPDVPEIWFRRAHHLTYNMSVEFEGYESRYAWVRRGIEALLDGVERGTHPSDLLWMTGKFVGDKIGLADEREQYRRLFAEDRELQRRLAALVDLDQARSPLDGRVDNWRVAQLLFQRGLNVHRPEDATLRVPPILFHSGIAVTKAQIAAALDEAGKWDEAARAWKAAERVLHELGNQPFPAGEFTDVRLSEWSRRRAQRAPPDSRVKRVEWERSRTQYDYWLARCSLEQQSPVRTARKLAFEAGQQLEREAYDEALRLYRETLQAVRQLDQLPLIAESFRPVAVGYRRAAAVRNVPEDEELELILQSIEQAPPTQFWPLVEAPP